MAKITDVAYDLRNPYNLVSVTAQRALKPRVAQNSVDRALYAVYCEALSSVRTAIQKGVGIEELAEAISHLSPEQHRLD